MKSRKHLYPALFVLSLTITSFAQVERNAKVFTVTSTADSFDASPGDGRCSDAQGRCTFRAALNEVGAGNVVGDAIVFSLPNPSTIDLTLGEILVQGQCAILGPGADRVTIQRSFAGGTPEFRLMRLVGLGTNLDLRSVTLKNGKSAVGGAIYAEQSWLRLTNVVVAGNQATDGGGIYSSDGSVWIMRSLFHSNAATGAGGAIILAGSSLHFPDSVILNTTITNNQAQTIGAIRNARSLSLVNNTITHNSATGDISGVMTSGNGTTYVANTIIGSNPLPQFTLSGAFISRGNNIITDGRNSTGFADGVLNDRVGTSNSIDPMVGPLADNGGGLFTRSLLAGSIAIDAGNDCSVIGGCQLPTGTNVQLAYDQRHRFGRRAGTAIDIGAFELNASKQSSFISFTSSLVESGASGAFYANTPVVMTDVFTGQSRHSFVTPKGEFAFYDAEWTSTSVIEIRAKRRLPYAVKVFPY